MIQPENFTDRACGEKMMGGELHWFPGATCVTTLVQLSLEYSVATALVLFLTAFVPEPPSPMHWDAGGLVMLRSLPNGGGGDEEGW